MVYPRHEAAVIGKITTRAIGDTEHEYLKLRVAQANLTVQIPSESVEMVGAHNVVDKEDLEHVFEMLWTTKTEEPSNWSRRYKANVGKTATDDVIKVAEVVRDLSHRDSKKGLSAEEKRVLNKARQVLVSEFALAEKTNEEDASNRLNKVLVSQI